MKVGQHKVKSVAASQSVRGVAAAKSRVSVAACFLLTGLSAAAHAQFAGPALPLPSQANQVILPSSDPALLSAQPRDQVLAADDLLAISIFGVASYAPAVRVGADGTVQLPLIGLVHVAGLTIPQAENLISKDLNDAGMYLNPSVSITATDPATRFVTVVGELHATVPIPVTGERRLLEVLAVAGNFPPTASHTITILRPGLAQPIVVELGPDPVSSAKGNIVMQPRDTVVISRVGVVYVLGAFHLQGAIPLQQNAPLTLLQLVSLAGGAGYEGKYKDLRIIRTEGLQRKLVTVDYKRILNGHDPDPVLAADDIVFLPTDLIKGAIKSGGVNTLATVVDLFLLVAQTRGN